MNPTVDSLNSALAHSRRGADLDDIARRVWAAMAAGTISEQEAQRLAEQVEARRGNGHRTPCGAPQAARPVLHSIFPPRRVQRALRRPVAVARRRRVAAAGALPPPIAAQFTTGEQAVLTVVATEVMASGACQFPLDKIAAMAGVSRSTAKNALRTAGKAGLLLTEIRPRRGQKNLPNRITITSKAWQAWLVRGPRDRGQKDHPHEYQNKKKGFSTGRTEPSRYAGQAVRGRKRWQEGGRATLDTKGMAK